MSTNTATVTFRVSKEEKQFMEEMAKFNGISLSELSKKAILESLEDQIDLATYDKLIKKHHEKDESISHEEMMKELGL